MQRVCRDVLTYTSRLTMSEPVGKLSKGGKLGQTLR